MFDDAGSDPKTASRAGLIGSSSVRRTTSTFGVGVGVGVGGLSLLADGGETAAAARVGGADAAAFSRGGGEAGDDWVAEATRDLLVSAPVDGLPVVGASGAGRSDEAI